MAPSFYSMDQGLVDQAVRDRRARQSGDLANAVGVEYRPGSTEIFTTGMRALAGTFGSAAHWGLAFAQYDSAADKLIAGSGTSLFEATAATSAMTGTQAQLEGGNLTYASTPVALLDRLFNERLYLASAVGLTVTRGLNVGGTATPTSVTRKQNIVRKADGTYLLMGLLAPVEAPTVAAPSTAAPQRVNPTFSATAGEDEWQNRAKAYDTGTDQDQTYSSAYRTTPGTKVNVWKFGTFTTDSSGTWRLRVLHAEGPNPSQAGRDVGVGGGNRNPVTASLKIEYSTNSGGAWTTLSDKSGPYTSLWSEFKLPISTVFAANQLQVRATLTFTSGDGLASGFAFTIKVISGGTAVNIVNGFRYVITEWDDVNGRESAYSEESDLVPATSGATSILLTMPVEIANFRATHWRIYRQTDGAALHEFDRYGKIGEIPIASAATFVDTFELSINEVALPVLPVLITGIGEDITFHNRNTPPPLFKSMDFYKGCLFGIPVDDPDNVYYSQPFEPESFPDIYSIPSRSPRDDTPVAVRALDEVLLVFYPNWTRSIRGVALVVNGLFDQSAYTDASTTRGCAGPLAIDTFTQPRQDGQHWAAVMDSEGLYITNGLQFIPWSDNLLWKSEVDPAHLAKTIVKHNLNKRRVEVYYVKAGLGATNINRRLDFYYGEMRQDGQPKLSGRHFSVCRGIAWGIIGGQEERFTASPNSGAVYREDSGFSDASLAYDASGNVPRTIQTNDIPIAGLGGDSHVQQIILRTDRGSFSTITQTVDMKFSTGEVLELSASYTPSAPAPLGVFASGETLAYQLDDTSTTEKARILGFGLDAGPLGKQGGALRASLGSSAGTTALPS